jgi:ComF family protein
MTHQPGPVLTRRLSPWWLAVKTVLWPEFCRTCGVNLPTEENGYFCPACWERSPAIVRPYCTCCGQPHAEMRGLGLRSNYPCATCRDTPPKHISRIYGAARYESAVADAVKLLKFQGKTRLVAPLVERMADFAAAELPCEEYQLLVPVPLHRVRQRSRGFNQAALLAEGLLPAFPGAALNTQLQRIRPTRTQSRLKPEERRKNLRGAFAVLGEELHGANVLLVDDVVTTAGTVSECARVLLMAGAGRVDVFAAALSARKIID